MSFVKFAHITVFITIFAAVPAQEVNDNSNNALLTLPPEVLSNVTRLLLTYKDLAALTSTCHYLQNHGQEKIDQRIKATTLEHFFTFRQTNQVKALLTRAQQLNCQIPLSLEAIKLDDWKELGDLTLKISSLQLKKVQLFPMLPVAESSAPPRMPKFASQTQGTKKQKKSKKEIVSTSSGVFAQIQQCMSASLFAKSDIYTKYGTDGLQKASQMTFFHEKTPLINITRLSLVDCNITNAIFNDIDKQFNLSQLTHLDLTGNPLQFQTEFSNLLPSPFVYIIVKLIQNGILSLNISGIQHPRKLIYELGNKEITYKLECLIMDSTTHTKEEIHTLFQSQAYPQIAHLSMRNSKIKSDDIPESLNPSGLPALTYLDLAFNDMNEAGILRLLSLPVCKNLKVLDLTENPGLTETILAAHPFVMNTAPIRCSEPIPQK